MVIGNTPLLVALWIFGYQGLNLVVFLGNEDSFWLSATAARIGAITPMTTVLVMSCRNGLFFEWP